VRATFSLRWMRCSYCKDSNLELNVGVNGCRNRLRRRKGLASGPLRPCPDLTGYQLRRVNDTQGNGPVLNYGLRIADRAFPVARVFIVRHHEHCDPPRAWRFGFSVFNGAALMAVVTVGNPVAPALMTQGIVEVSRLRLRRDLNPMLRWNCCSMLYAQSAREAERRGFNRIITYTRVDEDGASLRAAGWTCEGLAGGQG
jgi:hypothetical protein